MDFAEMQSRVRTVVRDDASLFVTVDDVKDWLNEGNEELAHRLKILHGETVGVVGATQTVTVPTGVISIETLFIDDEDIDVDWVNDTYFNKYRSDVTRPYKTIGRVFNGKIELRPKPAVGAAYTLRYTRGPATMTADADVSELPTELHTKIVNYARYQAKLKEGEMSDADRYYAEWEKGLPPPPNAQLKNRPGPMSLRYQPNPYDRIGSHRG